MVQLSQPYITTGKITALIILNQGTMQVCFQKHRLEIVFVFFFFSGWNQVCSGLKWYLFWSEIRFVLENPEVLRLLLSREAAARLISLPSGRHHRQKYSSLISTSLVPQLINIWLVKKPCLFYKFMCFSHPANTSLVLLQSYPLPPEFNP